VVVAGALAVVGCGGSDARRQDPIPGVVQPKEWPAFEAVISEVVVIDGDPDRECRREWSVIFHAVDRWTATAADASAGPGCDAAVVRLEQDDQAVWEVTAHDRAVRASGVGRLAPHPVFEVAYPKVPYGDFFGASVDRSRGRVSHVEVIWCAEATPDVCADDPGTWARKRFTFGEQGIPRSVVVDGPGTAGLRATVEELSALKVWDMRVIAMPFDRDARSGRALASTLVVRGQETATDAGRSRRGDSRVARRHRPR
jgi:hypothetical protein